LIGKSTHSIDQALAAQEEGPDYIGFGPLYATGTKPDYTPVGLADLSAVHAQVKLPIFCIGGVNLSRIEEVVHAGARRVVAVSALLLAEKIEQETRYLKAALP
jgi:thiamine-phosphate pyrophosphorylase